MIFLTVDWAVRGEDICMRCGGHCCVNAHPPVSRSCAERLLVSGISPDQFEYTGYKRLKVKENGVCILSEQGVCRIHSVKPETCRAGPFTFDVKGDIVEIYIKNESVCPIVKLLREVPEAYRQQYERAVQNITHLVQHLTDDELLVICRIAEPETEKVSELPRKYR